MKKAHVISMFCALLFLCIAGSAGAQPLTPAQCALAIDPVNCCDRATDETTRLETARLALKVNARVVGGVPDEAHYHKTINYWAVAGAGEDNVGYDGGVYLESTLTNYSRQEMWDYLVVVFGWSSDMELVTVEELWETAPDNSFTYMAIMKWYGNTEAGYYEQPGISVLKFRPGEGCVSYQRDYFSEGDTYWGMSFTQDEIRQKRNIVISSLGLDDRCLDEDNDGFTRYEAAAGCDNPGLDCDDYRAAVNPGETEIHYNGLDDDCNPLTPDVPPPCFIGTAAF